MSILKVSIRQIKAARALLDWSQSELAERSNVSEPTVKRLEASDGDLGGRTDTAQKLTSALVAAGIEFINNEHGEGVVKLGRTATTIDTDSREMVQYPEFEEGDGGPGSGG